MTPYDFPIFSRFQDNTNRLCFEDRPNRVVDFIRNLPEGAVLLDIGANQGAMTILASRVVGKRGIVLAFEPCAATAARLNANLELNQADNVAVFQQGIGSESHLLSIGSADPLHSGAACIGGGGQRVMVSPLFDIPEISSYLVSRPVYANVDTEGYELEVLRGLKPLLGEGRIRQIIIEINDAHLRRFGDCAAILYDVMKSYGYVAEQGLQSGHYDEVFTWEGKSQ
jgi:FkbM family methyltransferase